MTETPLLLGGRYELGDVIGRGGMAEVHAGRDLRLSRTIAIKVLRADLARDPSFQARFRREAQSAAALNHPSIVAVYDTGEDLLGGHPAPYIVMEYVDGSTLRELLSSGRRLLPERALEITAGVLTALDYSHRHGIVHRDIKPGNVMLTPAGDVKVMDFGIARAVADAASTMTQTSTVIGTAQYLSPEQARGEPVDARSDLYSTGCVLYELLVGRAPFVGDTPIAVAYQHVREEPRPPSEHDPDIPPAVDAVTLKALAKDREVRYQSAADMRADVERALAGRPVESPATATQRVVVPRPLPVLDDAAPLPPREEPPARRRGVGFWLPLLLVMLAVFVGAWLLGRALTGGGGDAAEIAVPRVIGAPEQQAKDTLTRAGLRVGEIRQQASDERLGVVIEQDPGPEEQVAADTAVALTVSTGPDSVPVPAVVGQSLAAARTALSDAGLAVGSVAYGDSPEPAGEVLTVTPTAGTPVVRGSGVTLRVASGRNLVPDVRGRSSAEARAALEEAGFRVAVERQPVSDPPPDRVISTVPRQGASARVGSTVTIAVSQAPAPTPTPEPPPPSVPESPPPEEPPTPAVSPSPTA